MVLIPSYIPNLGGCNITKLRVMVSNSAYLTGLCHVADTRTEHSSHTVTQDTCTSAVVREQRTTERKGVVKCFLPVTSTLFKYLRATRSRLSKSTQMHKHPSFLLQPLSDRSVFREAKHIHVQVALLLFLSPLKKWSCFCHV